jgi:hypothetical protein
MPDLPLVTELSRRAALRLLGVAAVGLLAGCRRSSGSAAPATATATTSSSLGASTTPAPARSGAATPSATATGPSIDPVVERAATAERALLQAYDTAALARPDLAGALAPLRADHAAHLHGLLPDAIASPPAIASSDPAASTSPSDAVMAQLATLEGAAAAARLTDVAATGGSLARLLASIGGCEAAHAALLVVT